MLLEIVCLITILFPLSNTETAVLILARGGSKGIRMKNLQKVGNISLLSRAIFTAKAAGFDDITVSTDHPLIALQAVKDNATVFHRSPVTAIDSAPSIWGAAEFLAFRPDITILVLIQTTSPFTQPIHLRGAIEKINYPRPFDCVFSATRSFKLRWSLVNGKLHPANFNADARIRRQDWNGEFLETGAFYIARRVILEQGKFQNNK